MKASVVVHPNFAEKWKVRTFFDFLCFLQKKKKLRQAQVLRVRKGMNLFGQNHITQ